MTHVLKAALWFLENRGQSKTGHPSITQMAHLWPSRSSKLPLHCCHGNHSAEPPEGMERGEGRWRRHVVTFLEKPICSFLSENHIGGGGKKWVLGCRRERGTDFKIQKKQSSWLRVLPSIRGGKSPTRASQSGPCQVLLHRNPSADSSNHVTLGFEGLLAEGDRGHGQAGWGWETTVSHNRISSSQGGQPEWCPFSLCPLAP